MKCPHCGKETEEKGRPEHFLIFWKSFQQAYPRRVGGQRWPRAGQSFAQHMKRGINPVEMVAAAQAYSQFCVDRYRGPSEYIMQAATFLGDGGGWEEDWSTETPFDQARRQLQETS